MAEGIDALAHPDPAAAKAAGKAFECLYTKNTTRADIDAVHAAGLAVVLLSEQGGRDALTGWAGGVARAQADLAYKLSVGAPAGVAVIAAETDFEPTPDQLPTVVQYYLGHQSVLAEDSGAYGDFAVMVALYNAGYRGVLMQTYAWSHGLIAPHIALEQYLNGQHLGGVGVDLDRAFAASYGAWLPPGAAPVPKPVPALPEVSLAHLVVAATHDPQGTQGHISYRQIVLLVERALVAEKLLAPRWADGSFGTLTVKAYAAWQQKLGYTGVAANGIPGVASLTALGRRHGFAVTR